MSALLDIRSAKAVVAAANTVLDQMIIEARADGFCWVDIANELGITPNQMIVIKNRLGLAGVAHRKRHTRGPRTPKTYAAVEALRKEGKTFEEIGDELGIATQHAWIIAKKLGLTSPRHRAGQEQRA